jgi:8-oxo-dGTP pyrophosphatase MutT (NUDIX family)
MASPRPQTPLGKRKNPHRIPSKIDASRPFQAIIAIIAITAIAIIAIAIIMDINYSLLPVTEQELNTPSTGRRNRCYGGILRRHHDNREQFLLVKGRQTGIWSFPKGHSNKGETALECALREIREETGLSLEKPSRVQRLKGCVYFVFDILPNYPHSSHPDLLHNAFGSHDAFGSPQDAFGSPQDAFGSQETFRPQDENEIEETRWVTREEMEYLIVNSGVKDFLQRNLLFA